MSLGWNSHTCVCKNVDLKSNITEQTKKEDPVSYILKIDGQKIEDIQNSSGS